MDPSTNSMIKILVVEDEPIFRGLLGSVLESSGYHVEFANDGLQALEILVKDHRRFDLVITDIQMPRMSGLELAKELMAQSEPVPMIAMTGFGDMELVVHLLRLGVEDFLEKPFGFEDMSHRVSTVLARHKEKRERKFAPEVIHRGYPLQLDRNPEEVRRLLEGMRDELDVKSAQGEGLLNLTQTTGNLHLQWKCRKVANFGGTMAILRTNASRSALLLARPMGHDRASLQLSVMVRILHEAMWLQYPDPEELLRALGRILLQQKMQHPLLAAAIHLDSSEELISVASAGFPSPLPVGTPSRRATVPLPRSQPLGSSPNMDVEFTQLRFAPGDRILFPCPSLLGLGRNLPTGARIELGHAGVEELANEHQELALPELVERVWQGCLEYSHWHSAEDLLLVGVERWKR
jgi:DNA-binding response OmpR family regulator